MKSILYENGVEVAAVCFDLCVVFNKECTEQWRFEGGRCPWHAANSQRDLREIREGVEEAVDGDRSESSEESDNPGDRR